MDTKKVPAPMWEEIYRVSTYAHQDRNFYLRGALIQIGERHRFTEQDLIDAQILSAPPKPKPGASKGARRA